MATNFDRLQFPDHAFGEMLREFRQFADSEGRGFEFTEKFLLFAQGALSATNNGWDIMERFLRK